MGTEPAFRKKAEVGEFYYVGLMTGGIPVLHPQDAVWRDGIYLLTSGAQITVCVPRTLQRELACGPFVHAQFWNHGGVPRVRMTNGHSIPLARLAGKSVQIYVGIKEIIGSHHADPTPAAVLKTAAA